MHPPGLNLDFLFGRGYLSTSNHRVGDFATVDSLRMEIPDLTFPFDARGGVGRFRNTRCQLRQLRLVISESGLDAMLGRAVEEVQGYEELRVRFVEGAAHLSTRVRTLGSDTFLTFKASAIPPEPSRGDALHIFLHDVRPYGPVPYPARLLVSELVSRLMQSPALQPSGAGKPFDVFLEGDLVELRPIKLVLMEMFAQHGWKLPSVAGLRFESVTVQPGSLSIAVRVDGQAWERPEPGRDALAETAATRAGAQALAAYEARDLLAEADAALFEGQLTRAIDVLRGLRERYGLHPAIVEGMLDTLLAAPGPGHVAEAQSIVDELLRSDPENLRGHLAQPTLALMRGDQAGAVRAYQQLAELLKDRGESTDLVAASLACAMVQRRQDPEGAVKLLREVTRLAPRNRIALEMLRELYAATDDVEGQVDVLRQLAGMYAERDALLDVYQQLATLLMERRNDLTEARLFLEKTLRLDPGRLQALFSLGESYVLDGQPLRAIRAFGSAARAAQERGDRALATELHVKNAELWRELGDFNSALLECRRALGLSPDHRKALELAVLLARDHGTVEEVLGLLAHLVPLAEADVEQAAGGPERSEAAREARRIHGFAAEVASARHREDTAAAHHRKALAYRRMADGQGTPELALDPSVAFLDHYYRQMGKPEDLIELYEAELEAGNLPAPQRSAYHRTLAAIFDQVLGLGSEAVEHLRRALDIDPDDDVARDAVVELLSRRQRHYELRDILADLASRVRGRRARGRVLLELGRVHLGPIADVPEAARRLREAQAAVPADPEIAAALVEAEKRLLSEGGTLSEEGSRLLLRALERRAEVAASEAERVEALIEAGDIALDHLHQAEDALAFFRRARAISDAPLVVERLSTVSRLLGLSDELTDRSRRPERPELTPVGFDEDEGSREATRPFTPAPPDLRPRRTPDPPIRRAMPATMAPTIPPPQPLRPAGPRSLADTRAAEDAADLESFRASFREVTTRPATLADGLEAVKRISGTISTRRTPVPPRLQQDPDEAEPILEPRTVQLPAAPPRRDTIIARLAELRAAGDVVALRDQLATYLLDRELDTALTARLHRDLGMLYYYDMEDAAAAEPHLSDARRMDPEGVGAEFDVLTALEGIYEDLDAPAGLVAVYEAKLAQATDPDMAAVYGLLAAELLWERLHQAAPARAALDRVLSLKAGNEPALRMLADIHLAEGDTAAALGLLRQLRDRNPEGSFERLEALRELGRVLIADADALATAEPGQARDALTEAADAFRTLMQESPGESEAMVQLKRLLERLERWDEALALLGTELGLLLGRPGAFPAGPPEHSVGAVSSALAVPASQILVDASRLHAARGSARVAIALLTQATSVWPENVEALEQRVALLRSVLVDPETADKTAFATTLAVDLENLAGLLVAPQDRLAALVDAAEVLLFELDQTERARAVLGEALEAAGDGPWDAAGTARVEAARELLAQLTTPPPPLVPTPEATPPPEPPLASPPNLLSTDRDEARDDGPFDLLGDGDGPVDLLGDDDGPLDPLDLLDPDATAAVPLDVDGLFAADEPPSLVGDRRRDFGFGVDLSAFGWLRTKEAAPAPPPAPSHPQKSPEGSAFSDSLDAGWLDEPLPDFPDLLDDTSDDLSQRLAAVDLAEQRGDRAALLSALDAAVTASIADPTASNAIRRQLLVRQAETHLGLRPTPAADVAPPSPADLRAALDLARAALDLPDADEPEAYLLAARALAALGQTDAAMSVLLELAEAMTDWDDGFDDPDADTDLEERLVHAARALVPANATADAVTAALRPLADANPRVAGVIAPALDPR